MKGKSVMVRFSESEVAAVEAILARFPNVSASTVLRAVLLASPRLWIVNALAKHALGEVAADED